MDARLTRSIEPVAGGMSRRRLLTLAGMAVGAAVVCPVMAESGRLETVTRKSNAFGAEICLTILHESAEAASRAADAAMGAVGRVDELMSLYRPDSQIRRLNRDGVLDRPDAWMVEVVRMAGEMSGRSGGAFDITVQPLWELYAAAKGRGKLPGRDEIEAARAKVDWRKVEVSADRIALKDKGMGITLNAIAQGYAADKALAALRREGIEHALVNTGEIGTLGSRGDGRPWRVGIQHPRVAEAYVAMAELDGKCMATSGDYATSFSEDHVHNHIFDPASGGSPREFASATVVAKTGAEADALATAVFVLGYEKGLKLLKASEGAESLFVKKDGGVVATAGFPMAGGK